MKLVWLGWALALLLIAVVVLHVALALVSRQLAVSVERANPPIGTFLDASGGRLHYLDSGPANTPVVVLLHGANTSLLDFQTSLWPRLEGRFRLIAIDRPGSGYSAAREDAQGDPARQADAVVQVLDSLAISEALWVGHSWGGSVVMAAMLQHPERVSGGIALAAATHPWNEPLPLAIRLAAVPVIGHVLAACWAMPLGQRMLAEGTAASFRPEKPPADLEAYLRETGAALTVRPRSLRATALDLLGLNEALSQLASRYAYIDRPLLLVVGSADPLIPPERNADQVAEVSSMARTRRIKGAGHIVHHTHAAEVAALITDFASNL